MKNILSITFIMLFAIGTAVAKDKPVSKHTTVEGKNVTITYGQPSKRGRLIFGDAKDNALVPYGEVWRAGADAATEVTVAKDCLFAGRQLSKGTYTMFVIPNRLEWTIILNKELKQWGAFGYDKIKDKNVIEAAVPAKQSAKSVETFTITVNDEGFVMEWDKVKVSVPVKPFQ